MEKKKIKLKSFVTKKEFEKLKRKYDEDKWTDTKLLVLVFIAGIIISGLITFLFCGYVLDRTESNIETNHQLILKNELDISDINLNLEGYEPVCINETNITIYEKRNIGGKSIHFSNDYLMNKMSNREQSRFAYCTRNGGDGLWECIYKDNAIGIYPTEEMTCTEYALRKKVGNKK